MEICLETALPGGLPHSPKGFIMRGMYVSAPFKKIFLVSSESSNLKKKNSEPQAPYLWLRNPLSWLCLPMPRHEDGSSCFMNGGIWVAVNTAILKIDV